MEDQATSAEPWSDAPLGKLEGFETAGFDQRYLDRHDEADPVHLLRTLVRSSANLIVVLDEKGDLVYANPAAGRALGFGSVNEVAHSVFDLIHPDDQEAAALAFLRDIAEPGVHPSAVYRVRTADSTWRHLEVVATNCLTDPVIEGVVLNCRDVTTTVQLVRALQTFGRTNQVLVHAASEAELLSAACESIVDAGGYGGARVVCVERSDPGRAEGEIVLVVAGQLEATPSLDEAARLASSERCAQVFESASLDVPTSCSLPLISRESLLGVLQVTDATTNRFDAKELELLSELADALGYGIGRLRDAASLRMSEARFASVAAASPVGILVAQVNGLATYSNPRLSEITGVETGSLLGRGWRRSVHPDDIRPLLSRIDLLAATGAALNASFRVIRPDGETRHVRISAATMADSSEYVITINDVTEEVIANEALAHRANHDPLTELPNRGTFFDRLREELTYAERGTQTLAVLFLDLDRMKHVNDSLGHDAGDAVLREVGGRLLAATRTGELAARFGGDEFIFLLRDVAEASGATRAAERLLATLSQPIRYGEHALTVTASIGIVLPEAGDDAEVVLRHADAAMYEAKAEGRNRWKVYTTQEPSDSPLPHTFRR